MPRFIISVHLEGGSCAQIIEDALNIQAVEGRIQQEMRAPDQRLRIQLVKAVLDVDKSRVVGWTIDEDS